MSDGNHAPKRTQKSPKAKTTTTSKTASKNSEYNYGDVVVSESGKKSRGGLKSLAELYADGVELVSGDLLSPTFKEKITIGIDGFTLNSSCVRLFETQNAELSMDKPNQRLIVLPCDKNTKDTAKIALCKEGVNKPRKVVTKKFCALLFYFMGWSFEHRYRIMAINQTLEGRKLLVFNLDEAVEIQSTTIITDDGKRKTTRDIFLPVKFKDSFGFSFSEVEERKKVDLDGMFLFINPHTGEEEPRKIEPLIPNSDDIIKSNYRPNPNKKKRKTPDKSTKSED
jgi:hypothetical protein